MTYVSKSDGGALSENKSRPGITRPFAVQTGASLVGVQSRGAGSHKRRGKRKRYLMTPSVPPNVFWPTLLTSV
jgi:hypothetical protein